ncbi:MAG: peptidoglycan DD-metalloendopeptidase family protein [Pseudomonadota bacterium]
MRRQAVWIAVFVGLGLVGCVPAPDRETPAPVVFEGSNPDVAALPAPVVLPPVRLGEEDPRGVITYQEFQVVRAREGDSITSIATRIGADPALLAEYNALPRSHTPQAGDLLALMPDAGRYGVTILNEGATPAWSPTFAAAAIANANAAGSAQPAPAPAPAPAPVAVQPTTISPAPIVTGSAVPLTASTDPSVARNGISPVRHSVGPGESVFTISRLYGVSVTSITAWNGMGANLSVEPGDLLFIPIAVGVDGADAPAPTFATPAPAAAPVAEPVLTPAAPVVAAPATAVEPVADPLVTEAEAATPAPAEELVASVPVVTPVVPPAPVAVPLPAPVTEPTPAPAEVAVAPRETVVSEPPSADDPLPENISNVETPAPLALSDVAEDTALFVAPVTGPVLRPFSSSLGSARNDGIDFSAPAGTDVRAADTGQVVYVARSVGDFDNIVMIRHPNDLVTAYARLGDVRVARGDQVARGQTIGTVAQADQPSVQFQVLRNMSPVDPAPFL